MGGLNACAAAVVREARERAGWHAHPHRREHLTGKVVRDERGVVEAPREGLDER